MNREKLHPISAPWRRPQGCGDRFKGDVQTYYTSNNDHGLEKHIYLSGVELMTHGKLE